jgi:hypothetical protein
VPISGVEAVVALVAGIAMYVASLALTGWRTSRAVHAVCLALGVMAFLAVIWFATYI